MARLVEMEERLQELRKPCYIIMLSTTCRTLRWMSFTSRRSCHVLLLSIKNRKLWLQWTQIQQNCTGEDWKNIAWSDEFWFLLRLTDGGDRIWWKQHDSMDPACLLSRVQKKVFLAHFGLLIVLSIVEYYGVLLSTDDDDHMHHFLHICRIYHILKANSSMKMHRNC